MATFSSAVSVNSITLIQSSTRILLNLILYIIMHMYIHRLNLINFQHLIESSENNTAQPSTHRAPNRQQRQALDINRLKKQKLGILNGSLKSHLLSSPTIHAARNYHLHVYVRPHKQTTICSEKRLASWKPFCQMSLPKCHFTTVGLALMRLHARFVVYVSTTAGNLSCQQNDTIHPDDMTLSDCGTSIWTMSSFSLPIMFVRFVFS